MPTLRIAQATTSTGTQRRPRFEFRDHIAERCVSSSKTIAVALSDGTLELLACKFEARRFRDLQDFGGSYSRALFNRRLYAGARLRVCLSVFNEIKRF